MTVQQNLERARAAMNSGAYSEADAAFRKVLEKKPGHRKALLGRIRVALAMQDGAAAQEQVVLARAHGHTPGLLEVQALQLQMKPDDALAQAKTLLEGAPKDLLVWLKISALHALADNRPDEIASFVRAQTIDPDHPAVIARQIRTLIATDRPDEALTRAREAVAALPGNRQLRLSLARAQRAMGSFDAAQETLDRLTANNADHAGFLTKVLLEQAALWNDTDQPEAAEAVYALILEATPLHRRALMGQIGCATDRQNWIDALTYADTALTRFPGDFSFLLRKAVVLRNAGQAVDALALLDAIEPPATGQWPLQIERARTLLSARSYEDAIVVCNEILAHLPDNPQALTLRVRAISATGDTTGALAMANAGLDQCPDEPDLLLEKARALRMLHRAGEALELLTELQAHVRPDDAAPTLLEIAKTCRTSGDLDRAADACDEILNRHPRLVSAHVERAEIELARGNPSKAHALMSDLANARGTSEFPAGLMLRLIEFALEANEKEQARTLFASADLALESLAPHRAIQLFHLALRFGEPEIAARALGAALDAPVLPFQAARSLLEIVHASKAGTGDNFLVDAIVARCANTRRDQLQSMAALIRNGPEAALALARLPNKKSRDEREAANLAQLLELCGKRALALRYLWFCRRRWPESWPVLRQTAETLMAVGMPHHALTVLGDFLKHRKGQVHLPALALRARVLTENGQPTAAWNQYVTLNRLNADRLPPEPALRSALALGRYEDSVALSRKLQNKPRVISQVANQFGPSLAGSLLLDLRLTALARDEGENEQSLRARLFRPASETIDTEIAKTAAKTSWEPTETAIPRRVMQYWDTPEMPSEIDEAMASWRDCRGFEHIRFDRADALAFLHDRFGPEHSRAFRLANHVAEECDYFRLCWLFAEGGIYADADDRLTGDLENVLSNARGAVFAREPHGAVINNFICARKAHPVIGWAVEQATASLLACDNDNTWFKTGPGLMTRALAVMLASGQAKMGPEDVALLSSVRLRRVVRAHLDMPYKKTPQYWNAHVADFPESVENTLAKARANYLANEMGPTVSDLQETASG